MRDGEPQRRLSPQAKAFLIVLTDNRAAKPRYTRHVVSFRHSVSVAYPP